MANAALNSVLEQSGLLLIPKIDTQLALAGGADPKPALANNPVATAPATNAPVTLRRESMVLVVVMILTHPERTKQTGSGSLWRKTQDR